MSASILWEWQEWVDSDDERPLPVILRLRYGRSWACGLVARRERKRGHKPRLRLHA